MKNVSALTRRELVAYFLSPTAYVVLMVIVLLTGYIYFDFLSARREALILPVVRVTAFMLMLVAPLLTMRLFADEFQSGTIETLMTAPVTTVEVVLSKYLAALFFLLVVLVPPILYAGILYWASTRSGGAGPDAGPILAGYLGLYLLGAYFLAIGLVASSWVRSQISAAVVTVVILLMLQIPSFVIPEDAVDPLSRAIRYISYTNHFYDVFDKGILDTRHIVYFLTTSMFCVFLTTVVVTVRRWR